MTFNPHDSVLDEDAYGPSGPTTGAPSGTRIAEAPGSADPSEEELAEEALRRAQRHRAAMIRGHLRRPGTSTAQLTEAAADPNPIVRRAVIAHPDCPPDLRLAGLQDPEGEVRAEVVRIAAGPSDLPADIVTNEKWAVRAALAERADCPAQMVVELLHHDPDPEVRRRALAAGVVRRDVVSRLLRDQPGAGATATDAAKRTPRFLVAVPREHAREARSTRGVDARSVGSRDPRTAESGLRVVGPHQGLCSC